MKKIKKYFSDFGTAVAKGDIWTKLSLVIMGAGYFGRKRFMKGLLLTLIEIGFFVFTFCFSWEYIVKLGTLGTVQRKEELDLVTFKKVVNDYDNSLLILLVRIIGLLVVLAFIALYISTLVVSYKVGLVLGDKLKIKSDYAAAFIGIIVVYILKVIPVVGSFVSTIAILAGLGIIYDYVTTKKI